MPVLKPATACPAHSPAHCPANSMTGLFPPKQAQAKSSAKTPKRTLFLLPRDCLQIRKNIAQAFLGPKNLTVSCRILAASCTMTSPALIRSLWSAVLGLRFTRAARNKAELDHSADSASCPDARMPCFQTSHRFLMVANCSPNAAFTTSNFLTWNNRYMISAC